MNFTRIFLYIDTVHNNIIMYAGMHVLNIIGNCKIRKQVQCKCTHNFKTTRFVFCSEFDLIVFNTLFYIDKYVNVFILCFINLVHSQISTQ